MTQQEFFQAMDDMGITMKDLYIRIGRCSGLGGSHGVYEKDGQWIYYCADERNHIDEEIIGSEEDAFDKMFRYVFSDLRMKKYITMKISEDIVKIDKQTVGQYICKTYSMSEQQAEDAWDTLKQDMHILFEFKYYVVNNEFVPERYGYKIRGYSAERIAQITGLSPLAAYEYMRFLRRKPAEALAELKLWQTKS